MTTPDGGDDVKDLVRRHWDGRAATFDDEAHHGIHTDEQRERWLSVLREHLGDDPARALDVGCGTGVVATLLAALGHDVTGVDFAPRMVGRATEKADRADLPVDVAVGDAEALPFATDAFDLVTARHLLWTLPNPGNALGEWRRVLGPDGRLLLIEGHWDHDEPWDEYEAVHEDLPLYDGRPPDDLAAFLSRHGLTVVDRDPLDDAVLWGREPRHDYYLVTARRADSGG